MISKKVRAVVEEYTSALPADTSVNLQELGVLDSLVLMNIFSTLEQEFDISFDAKDMRKENFQSIDTITKLVQKYI